MKNVGSITCKFPFIQNNDVETTLSKGIRITALVLGIISLIVALLILKGVPGVNALGTSAGWTFFSFGIVFILSAALIKCIKDKNERNSSSQVHHSTLPQKSTLKALAPPSQQPQAPATNQTTIASPPERSRSPEEIENENIAAFHVKRQITKGDEPLVLDVETLDFPYPQDKVKELRQVAKDFIKEINYEIRLKSSAPTIQERRCVLVNTNKRQFQGKVHDLIVPPPDMTPYEAANSFKTDEEHRHATYVGCVVKKLIDLGYIYKLNWNNGHGYLIQA